jgi:ferritin-like metal-binding protein YciE
MNPSPTEGIPMSITTLKDLYIDQLQDLYSANRQSLKVTRKLADKASNDKLKDALKRGVDGIQDGIDAVEGLIRQHGADPRGEFCQGMEGLVKEANAHAIEADIADKDVLDASIISQYQRMTHYALAGYGTVVAFARRLRLSDEVRTLQACLDSTYSGDREMSQLAEGEVNREAA